ncbi:MAG: RNA-binding protein [Candidatus Moranbacteria bacterium]|nr:RNA-binding protein [Candidatus Moranbacteria bacterium]
MSKKLFVGNISWGMTDEDLGALFSDHGTVAEAVVIKDRATGRSKGFGFVTFDNDEEADAAIEALNEKEIEGRNIVVNEARPPKPRM